MADTPLRRWLDEHGITVHKLSNYAKVTRQTLDCIARGDYLPSLVSALKIEKATGGGVPCESWLETSNGKRQWHAPVKYGTRSHK